ncbi:MAG: hypothetical protein M0R22_13835 [Dehalococcoidia bacterium]|jgi:hypothetical protein|nr:hypothetical protein [Dehalococcoidia bacterium]
MSASDELRAHLLVIYEHARDALTALDAGASLTDELIVPGGQCSHPESTRMHMLGGYWECPCGVKGRDT